VFIFGLRFVPKRGPPPWITAPADQILNPSNSHSGAEDVHGEVWIQD
jgi:hypothetical protein